MHGPLDPAPEAPPGPRGAHQPRVALDLVPKQAAFRAAGFTGFFGHVLGSGIAGTGVGWIAARCGWHGVRRHQGGGLRPQIPITSLSD